MELNIFTIFLRSYAPGCGYFTHLNIEVTVDHIHFTKIPESITGTTIYHMTHFETIPRNFLRSHSLTIPEEAMRILMYYIFKKSLQNFTLSFTRY